MVHSAAFAEGEFEVAVAGCADPTSVLEIKPLLLVWPIKAK